MKDKDPKEREELIEEALVQQSIFATLKMEKQSENIKKTISTNY